MLLYMNALICIVVTAYKFTSKLIPPLFFLQAFSHLTFVLCYWLLTQKNDNPRIRKQSEHLVPQLRILCLLHGFVIVFGYFMLSKCTESQPYPWAFVVGDLLFFASYAVCSQFGPKQLA